MLKTSDIKVNFERGLGTIGLLKSGSPAVFSGTDGHGSGGKRLLSSLTCLEAARGSPHLLQSLQLTRSFGIAGKRIRDRPFRLMAGLLQAVGLQPAPGWCRTARHLGRKPGRSRAGLGKLGHGCARLAQDGGGTGRPASPAKRILTRSSGCSARVDRTPPLIPAARFSSRTCRSTERTGGSRDSGSRAAHAVPAVPIAGSARAEAEPWRGSRSRARTALAARPVT